MSISKKLRFQILERDRFRCRYCGAEPGVEGLQVDHIRPRSAGGEDDPGNLVAACEDCNSGKRAALYEPRLKIEQSGTSLLERLEFERRLFAINGDRQDWPRRCGQTLFEFYGFASALRRSQWGDELYGTDMNASDWDEITSLLWDFARRALANDRSAVPVALACMERIVLHTAQLPATSMAPVRDA